jgi:tetratricopeptide (TPR) repeat protein
VSVIESGELLKTAKLALGLGYREVAVGLLEHLLKQLPGHVAALSLLAEQSVALEQWADAQDLFERVLRIDPLNLCALRGAGQVALARGSDQEAERCLRWACALYPDDAKSRELLPDGPDPLSAVSLARVLSAYGRFEEAVAYYEAAFERAMDRPSEQPIIALLLAEALWRTGSCDRARSLLETLVSQQPDWVRPRLVLADIAFASRQDSQAVAFLHDAAALDCSLAIAHELFDGDERYHSFMSQSPEITTPDPSLVQTAPEIVRYALRVDALPEPGDLQDLVLGEPPVVVHVQTAQQKGGRARVTKTGVPAALDVGLTSEQLECEEQTPGDDEECAVRVILSSRERLLAKYGDEAYQELDASLSELRERAAQSTGHEVIKIYVDDPACLDAYNLNKADPSDPRQVKALLQQLASQLRGQSSALRSVLIVGGDSVIPFYRLLNCTDDEDQEICSDWPYTVTDGNPLLSEFSLGRLPDGESGDPETLLSLVENAIQHHARIVNSTRRAASRSLVGRLAGRLRSKGGSPSSVGCSAEVWADAAREVFRLIGDADALQISPPMTDYDFLSAYERMPDLAYFNLHGFEGSAYWYGHGESDEGSPLLPVALTPLAISWTDAAGCVVYSEACYGAATGGGTPDTSIALSFLTAGALAFIGSTTMSYGSLEPPLSGADLLGKYLWEGVLSGLPVGCALRRARGAFVQAAATDQGYLDGEDQKTLLSFVLYGDPSLSLSRISALPELGAQLDVRCPPLTCRQRMFNSEPVEVSQDLRDKVQRRLPSLPISNLRAKRVFVCDGACSATQCSAQGCNVEPDRDDTFPELIVTSEQKDVSKGGNHLQHVIKVTVNADGDVTKVLMSRGGRGSGRLRR